MGATNASLETLRADIDQIDREIVALLARRFACVEQVVAVKAANGLPAHIPERVDEVIGRVRAQAQAKGLPADLTDTLWRAMIDWFIRYEDNLLPPRAP